MTNVTTLTPHASVLHMTQTKRNPRIRFHLSEEIAVELNHLFRKSGHRSWNELIRALLDHWNNHPGHLKVTTIEEKINSSKDLIENLVHQTGHFNLLLEGQIEALHSIHLGQEQLIAIVDRLNHFLELAFELAGEKLASQADHDQSPDNDVIHKIRNRQL